jgi:predicted outer membrane lipoprotein
MTTEVTEPQPRVPARTQPVPAAPPAVSTAILLATAPGENGGAAATLGWEDTTVLGRLADQAAGVGAGVVHVITRPEWAADVESALETSATGRAVIDGVEGAVRVERSDDPASDLRAIARIARETAGGLLIAHGEIVTQRDALAGLAADPRVATGVLATVGRVGRPFAQRTRSMRGRVISAASPYHGVHRPTTTFLGVLKVTDADRAVLVDVAERLAELTAPPLPEGWEDELQRKMGVWRAVLARTRWRQEMDAESPLEGDFDDDLPAPGEIELPENPQEIVLSDEDEAEIARRANVVPNDVAAMLVTGLVRSGAQVGVSHLRKLFWARPVTREEVERASTDILEHDEDKDLLDSSVKAADGFFTTFFVSPYSKYIARWCARRGFTPNQVTTVSVLIGFAAAAAFGTGERWGLVAGAVLLQIAFTTDCVDGQLARYTRQFSKLGAWLDSVFDRTKEYAVFAGLAIGYAASHGDDVWALAGAALTLQTVRHMTDFSFGAARQQVIGDAQQPPLEQPSDRVGAGGGARGGGRGVRGRAGSGRRAAPGVAPPPDPRPVAHARPRAGPRVGQAHGGVPHRRALRRHLAHGGPLGRPGHVRRPPRLGRLRHPLHVRRALPALGQRMTATALSVYRDDGPIAAALGRVAARVPSVALALAAALPLLVVIAVEADGASDALAGGVLGWAILLGGLSKARSETGRFRWGVPPLIRLTEYAGLLWIGALGDALPAAFALIAALAYRHYDLVYRLRHRGETPPAWVDLAGLGWDGRLLLGYVLLLAGALPAALYVLAAVLGVVFVAESVAGWTGSAAGRRGSVYEEEEDEGQ